MTEKEILQQQETNGQKSFYLIAVGMFYHAYGCGAFALSRATGYRVLRKHRKHGDILTCGFPVNQLEMVLQRIREADGEVEQTGEKTFLFRGLDGTPDERLIEEQKPQIATSPSKEVLQPEASFSWLANELLSFNLSLSTPMDAMNLIARLQKRLRDEKEQKKQEESQGQPAKEITIMDIACESPAGHGLQE
jgi:hypothetical protein